MAKTAAKPTLAKTTAARTSVITLRLSAEEHRLFHRVAARLGLPISGMLRFLVKQAAAAER